MDSVVVAWSPFETGALLWIAEDQDYFAQNGLQVTLRKYDTGVGSLNGVLNGEADIAMGLTEFPVVRRVFEKSGVRIIAAAARVEQQYVVGRRDRGIDRVSDLRGKRIGTTLGTIAEFYLGRFLELNGMSTHDVTVVDLKTPVEWENAVADGFVDAIVTAQPYAGLATRRLADSAIIWPAQGGQYIFGLVAPSQEWLGANPELAVRFLRSLLQAEHYAARHPPEAEAIVQKTLGVDALFAESSWTRGIFSLSLDHSLVVAMEDQARWMIRNGLTSEKQVPTFEDYIYDDALKAVKPQAVNIIR